MLLHGTPVDRVVSLLMEQYPDLPDDARRACGTAHQVIVQLCKYEDRVRNPEYGVFLDRLESRFPGPVHIIRSKPLLRQWGYHRQQYRGPWQKAHEFRQAMEDAPNPLRAPYSDFILPQEVYDMASDIRRERSLQRQQHININPDLLHLSASTANWIVQKAIMTATEFQPPVDSNREWLHMVNTLGILSGRRNYEIYKSLEWQPVQGLEYQAFVGGLCKDNHLSTGGTIIPLLCSYDVFDKCMRGIRAFKTVIGSASDNSGFSNQLLSSMEKYYEIHLTHSMRRNLYASVAYERRAFNQFLGGQGAKTYWMNCALGLYMERPPAVLSYQLINGL